MKIALVSDEFYPVHDVVVEWLEKNGHEVMLFGTFASRQTEQSWVIPTSQAALAIQKGDCEEGIFFCWTGTGVSIIANKVPGIRAALCTDAQTARGARIWNHANVLSLSNRLLSQDIAKEILNAWFEHFDAQKGAAGVEELKNFETTVCLRKT